MARKGSNTKERWYRNYPHIYARTNSWQSRRGRRVKETSQFVEFRGLNTVNSDFTASRSTSPFMANWRFANEKYNEQGASLVSRAGTKFLNDYGTVFTDIKPKQVEGDLQLDINTQVRFKAHSDKLIIGGSVRLRNRNSATGTLLIHYYQDEDVKPKSTAFIDLAKVGYEYANYSYRLIGGVKGDYTVRFEVIDEFDEEYYVPVSRPIEIGAKGFAGEKAITVIPRLNEALKENKLNWQNTSLIPVVGIMTNDWKFFGDLIEVIVKDVPYLIFVADNGATKKIGRFNLKNNDIDFLDGGVIPQEAKVFSGVLADGRILYVDGVSRLKYINVRDWTIHTANPEVDENLKAPEGAKYIELINNRIYLANFPDSPNLVCVSMINRTGAKYMDFHDRFYSPNIATYDSRTTPITGIIKYTENSVAIWREDGMSIFTSPLGFEFSGTKSGNSSNQQDTFSNAIGVAKRTDMVMYNGSVYFFNKSEGFRRFSGADATANSNLIDNLIRDIPEKSHRYMYAHNQRIHLQVNDYQLIFDISGTHTTSPWIMDTQRYIYRVYTEQKSDRLWASHSQYLCFMELNEGSATGDFDCVIPCEYQTQYVHSPDTTGLMIVHKIMAHFSKMSSTTWRVGFDQNHNDNPSVWTKTIFKQKDSPDNDTDLFYNENNSGSTMVNIGLHARCYVGQLRIKGYAYKDHIGLNGLAMETQNVEAD